MTEHNLRDDICRVGASLFARGYVHATAGNISVRLDDGGFLITPTDACLDALDPARLAALAEALAEQVRPGQDVNSDGPKALLRANTEAAQAAGVFGVPAFGVDGKLFWGLDGLPMLRAYLDGDAWFDGPAWDAVSQLPSGLPGKS